MAREFDFEQIIKLLRISHLMSHLELSRSQRLTVDFFRRYTVRELDIGRSEHVRGMSIEAIVNSLRPGDSEIDRKILYELAGVGLTHEE